jgi:hypothetical protein
MATKQLQNKATKTPKNDLKFIVEYVRQHKKLPLDHYSSLSKLDYYTKQLRIDGILVKKGYGVWDIDESCLGDYSRKELQNITDKQLQKTSKSSHSIRGHGFQFSVKVPSYIDWPRREVILNKSGIPYIIKGDGSFLVRIYGHKCHFVNNGIIVYFSKGKSFYGDNASESKNKATYELRRVVTRISNRLNYDLSHKGKLLFTINKAHYAEIENELAVMYNNDREKFHCIGDDGQEWLIIDFSNKVNELETVHSKRSLDDMNKLQPFFNDLRDNNLPLLSELFKSHSLAIDTIKNITNIQLNTQVEVQILATALNKILSPLIQETQPIPKDQKTIPEYIG